jgi:hypothetical protein
MANQSSLGRHFKNKKIMSTVSKVISRFFIILSFIFGMGVVCIASFVSIALASTGKDLMNEVTVIVVPIALVFVAALVYSHNYLWRLKYH